MNGSVLKCRAAQQYEYDPQVTPFPGTATLIGLYLHYETQQENGLKNFENVL